ncbi:TIR domain-containing protein [Streptomyces sp. NPDC057074]|uniref:TIR domain-containing protein n=1 Tax=Streptomyces sp. NPDC057074 TaxID=3346015 RepID=UPI0036313F2B
MPRIFINYRTSDALATATLLDRELTARFGADEIFRAGRSIGAGRKFPDEIRKGLRKCDVLVALIGPGWRDACTKDGCRALDDENDWVRVEITEAFRFGLSVLPVLLDRTPRLTRSDVPEALAELTEVQNLVLDHRYPDDGLDRIADAITAEVPELGKLRRPRPSGRSELADGGLRGNFFFGTSTTKGDNVAGDKHVHGPGGRRA